MSLSMRPSMLEVRTKEYNIFLQDYVSKYFAANILKRSLKRSLTYPNYLLVIIMGTPGYMLLFLLRNIMKL